MRHRSLGPTISLHLAVGLLALLVALGPGEPGARAVPSFTRQTGFPCSSCHTTPPELTPLGRTFKLNGYTLAGMPSNKVEGKGRESGLSLLQALPLSVLFETSFTSTSKTQPGTQNGSFEFPQDAALYLAGAWSTHVGSLVQVTYNTQDDHFSWDMTDIRYANSSKLLGKSLMYGITLNNAPTIEDLWHSTPMWSYPFVNSDSAPMPMASALVNMSLAFDTAGVGAYGMWNDHLYLAGTMYRSEHIGSPQPLTGAHFPINIHGVAPYWRVAWQQNLTNNYLEFGAYGMYVKSTPNSFTGHPRDSFTDWAADFQYDRTIPRFNNDILSLRGTFIHENSSLAAEFRSGTASQIPHHLNTLQANLEYHRGNRYSAAFGWFNTTGTRDSMLYMPGPIMGSALGSPKSNGYVANISWWPWQNIDLTAQYTGYLNFNGRSANYDGAGRNASDNNTVYLLARFIF